MKEEVTDLTRGVYRRVYSGFITGQRINKISQNAEAWFWRILVTVDDFGNGPADPDMCRTATAGRRKVTSKQISSWLREMKQAGLISFYTAKGEPFLHVIGFEESQPAGRNGKRIKRYPHPGESGCIQVNPEFSSASDNDTHNDTEDDNENDTQKESFVEQARQVFRFWQEHLNHAKAKLDDKREKAIKGRLKNGYSVEDLCSAVRGCKLTPWNMGKNDRNQVYDDIELICRDAEHVDRFMRNAGAAIPSIAERRAREDELKRKQGWDKLEQRTA